MLQNPSNISNQNYFSTEFKDFNTLMDKYDDWIRKSGLTNKEEVLLYSKDLRQNSSNIPMPNFMLSK